MEEALYTSIGESIRGSISGNLFGKACFKLNNKAFLCFIEKDMVFKLKGSAHIEAMGLENTKLFDPSGKGRPMKEWVQVGYEHHHLWEKFALEAQKYNLLSKKTMQ